MAYGNSKLTKTDLFVKSSVSDLQDPTFLTFDLDFFPVRQQYPRFDGLMNDNLLVPPPGLLPDDVTNGRVSENLKEVGVPNSIVEYSAYNWLNDYYGENYATALNVIQPHPAVALSRVISGLRSLQSSPWYFQSIQGIPDLWKQAQRVKEGNMKTTLTFNCLESIRMPLTDVAENYRYSIYDSERLAYRLPDNLRWFDMEIKILEARNLVDHNSGSSFFSLFTDNSLDLFERDRAGNVTSGIKVIKFRCKMCEFDFSDFLSGGGTVTEFSTVTPDKQFMPSFKINVGWVIQEEVLDQDVKDIHESNILTGAFNALSNKLSNTLSTIARLPSSIIGSAENRLQTKIEGKVIGNVYDGGGLNGISNAVNKFGAAVTGRKAPVGPSFADLTKSKIYENPTKPKTVGNGDLGDVY